jgi:hypothetical protein
MIATNIPIKPLIIIMIAVLVIAIIINNYNMPSSMAEKGSSYKQPQQQQDFATCVNKSMDKISNGNLNFSDPDPISHCFDQLFNGTVNDGNGTENKGGGNNDNNLSNNSSFANV